MRLTYRITLTLGGLLLLVPVGATAAGADDLVPPPVLPCNGPEGPQQCPPDPCDEDADECPPPLEPCEEEEGDECPPPEEPCEEGAADCPPEACEEAVDEDDCPPPCDEGDECPPPDGGEEPDPDPEPVDPPVDARPNFTG